MHSRPIGIGVLGAGSWACSAHLPSLKSVPNVQLVSVANRRLESARAVAETHGFDHSDPDAKSLLARDEIDAVWVTAPVPEHHALGLAAIRAGKHVLVESSLCMTAAQARELLFAAREAGVKHATTRPRPDLYGGSIVRQTLREGSIGTPRSALFTWRGNPWLHFDPAQNWRIRNDSVPPILFGIPAAILTSVFGRAIRVSARAERTDGLALPGTALGPDFASALIEFPGGLHATLQCGSNLGPPAASGLTVFADGGSLHWDWNRPGAVEVSRAGDPAVPAGAAPSGDLATDFPYARDFVSAIGENRPPSPGFEDGVAELDLVEACVASASRGGAATPLPETPD